MDNKKVKKFLKQISFYKSIIKPKYIKYYDDITSLYIDGKLKRIDQATKLLDKLTKRGNGPESSIKQINKLLNRPNLIQETKSKTKKPEEKSSQHHIVATFIFRSIYYNEPGEYYIDDKNADLITSKWDGSTPLAYSRETMPNIMLHFDHDGNVPLKDVAKYMYYSVEEYAETYVGKYSECVQQLKSDIDEKFEINDNYVRQDVIYIRNINKVNFDYIAKKELKNIKMKLAEPLKYSFLIPPNTTSKNENSGTCVDDAFLSAYPHISQDEFDSLCKDIEPENKKEDGRTSAMLHHVCVKKDISMYAFDLKKRCFLKHLSKNQNHKALVYYCINNHMYHIIDKQEVKSLVETAKDIETKINSDLFEKEEVKNVFSMNKLHFIRTTPDDPVFKLSIVLLSDDDKKRAKYTGAIDVNNVVKSVEYSYEVLIKDSNFKDEIINKNIIMVSVPLAIKENTPIKNLLDDGESCIVIYDKSNINDQLIECMNLGITPKIKKCKKTLVTYMVLHHPNNKDVKFYLYADSNKEAKYAEQGITYKKIMQLCKDHEIEFNNQTFPTFVRQLRDRKINEEHKRKVFTKAERIDFLTKHPYCENQDCGIKLLMGTFDIDHVHPLSAGGTNDESNLQALCKKCHHDKTQNEKDNNEHMKLSSTYSSFNQTVEQIMNSPLSQHYAFVEKLYNDKEVTEYYDYDENDDEILTGMIKNINQHQSDIRGYENEINHNINVNENDDDDDDDDDIIQFYKDCLKNSKLQITKLENEILIHKNEIKSKYCKIREYCIDVNGCRREALYNNLIDLPLFTVMDMPKMYDGNLIVNAKYYVETDQYMPFHGNGMYYYPLVKHGLETGLIKHENIKWYIEASLSTKHNYFNGFINWCMDNLGDLKKLSINSMIGYFGVNKESISWKSLGITEDLCEAYHNFIEYNGCFIDAKKSNRTEFFHIFTQQNTVNIETEKVLYDFILDLEAMELHKLETIIKEKGGKILEYKTDCIRFSYDGDFPFKLIDDKNLDGYFYDEDTKLKPKYKMEKKNRMTIECLP